MKECVFNNAIDLSGVLEKHGFVFCGIIEVDTASTDTLRDAYQKILK